jgi:hypothetical protein
MSTLSWPIPVSNAALAAAALAAFVPFSLVSALRTPATMLRHRTETASTLAGSTTLAW